MGHPENAVRHPALRTIGNIVTGDELQTQQVIDNGGLPKLLDLLNNENKGIRKETCWTISNITAGTIKQIQAVLENDIIQTLIRLLAEDDFDVKKEAAWALSNVACSGNTRQIQFLVHSNVVQPLCSLFQCGHPRIIAVALDGIENILRTGSKFVQQNAGINPFVQCVEECGGFVRMRLLKEAELPQDIQDKYQKLRMLNTLTFG